MRLSTSKYIDAIVFTLFSVVNLFFVSVMTDLKPAMGNWADKAREIMMLQVPTDNFYGPGGAISLIPFLWNGPTYVIANFFYCALGSFFFFLITKKIENTKIRYLSLSVLIFNPYIYWLFYSSQDTAVEFALLSLSIYALIRNRIWIYIFSTFILAETRSQYWVFFLAVSCIQVYYFRKELRLKFFIPFLLLFFTLIFNYVNYESPSPALEGGVTLELAHSQFYYLAHPEFDIDYLFDGKNGPLLSDSDNAPKNLSPAELNNFYTVEAFKNIKKYPKESILNLFQKLDSYVFSSQKVPNSNGYFKLDVENSAIKIIDLRISWVLTLGNVMYQIYRSILFLLFILTLGALLHSRLIINRKIVDLIDRRFLFLCLPWITTLAVCLAVYTETRFKVTPEIFLFLFSFFFLDKIYSAKFEKN